MTKLHPQIVTLCNDSIHSGDVKAYMARPKGRGKLPAVRGIARSSFSITT
jgi:hypothetical protein